MLAGEGVSMGMVTDSLYPTTARYEIQSRANQPWEFQKKDQVLEIKNLKTKHF